jgi:hypothetical protein
MLTITTFIVDTNAFNNKSSEIPEFSTSSKYSQQLFGYFILDLYHNEIIKAMQKYYL